SKSLRRLEPIEDNEQRESDRICENRFLLGAAPAHTSRNRPRSVRSERLLAPRFARPEHVQAHTRDDGGQPSAKIVDAGGIGAAQSQPRLLDSIVHLTHRAQHPVSHGTKVGPVLFKSVGQIVAFAHRSHSSQLWSGGFAPRTPHAVARGAPTPHSAPAGAPVARL